MSRAADRARAALLALLALARQGGVPGFGLLVGTRGSGILGRGPGFGLLPTSLRFHFGGGFLPRRFPRNGFATLPCGRPAVGDPAEHQQREVDEPDQGEEDQPEEGGNTERHAERSPKTGEQ